MQRHGLGDLIARATVKAVVTTVVAYLLGYALVCALPTFGASVLGLGAANPIAMEQFRLESDIPSGAGDALFRLVSGDLGMSLNRRPVSDEILDSASMSAPLFLMATLCVTCAAFIGALLGVQDRRSPLAVLRLLAFIPAYVPAYLAAAMLPLLGATAADGTPGAIGTLALISSLIPGAVVAGTVMVSISTSRHAAYFLTLRAHGYSELEFLRLTVPTTVKQLLPLLAGIVASIMMVQIFVEAVFGYPGVGSSLIQAIRRTDVNLVLAYVVVFAAIHSVVAGFASVGRQLHFGP